MTANLTLMIVGRGTLLCDDRTIGRAATAEIPRYNPAAPDLQPAALKARLTALAGRNENVAQALVEARNAIAERAALYEGEQSGLRSQVQQAKAAVASQFGRRSPEFKSISGIRF